MKARTVRRVRFVRAALALATAAATIGVTTAAASPTQAMNDWPASVGAGAKKQAETPAASLAEKLDLSRAEARERLASQPDRIALGERLTDRLGSRAAGFLLDQVGDTVVVNVVDERAAGVVRRAGATPRVVDRGSAELKAARDRLVPLLPKHTSAGIDTKANEVVVRIGSAAPENAKQAKLLATTRQLGDVVRVERFRGSYDNAIFGGDPTVTPSGGYCTLGFNTTGGTALTAGHCAVANSQWFDGCTGQFFGTSVAGSFPGNDFGLLRNDGGLPQPGEIRQTCGGSNVDITGAANPAVGMSICKSGATTGITCGTVTAVNQVVCYAEGCVDNMAVTNAGVLPGDSGGPWYSGNTAFGLTSGTTLPNGAPSFFQPVVEPLQAFGLGLL